MHGALDGLAGVGHAERVAVAADFAHNGRGGALLHLADGGAGVGIGQAARERRGRHVAQTRLANLVAQVAVAVGQVAHGGKVEAGVALGGKVLGLEHLEGLLALLALGLHGAVVARIRVLAIRSYATPWTGRVVRLEVTELWRDDSLP